MVPSDLSGLFSFLLAIANQNVVRRICERLRENSMKCSAESIGCCIDTLPSLSILLTVNYAHVRQMPPFTGTFVFAFNVPG